MPPETRQRIERLEGYLRQDPSNLMLRGDIVDLLLDSGQIDQARHHSQQALQQAPSDTGFRYRLAVIQHYSGELEAAHDALAGLLSDGSKEPSVWLELARVQADQADLEGAEQTLQSLHERPLSSDLAEACALLHVRVLHRQGKLDAAIELAERFLALIGSSRVVAAALATVYVDAGRMPDARRIFESAQHIGSVDSEMLAAGGFVALDAADPDAALRRFEDSLAQSPLLGRAQLGLGLVHAYSGRREAAKQALQQATRCMPTHLGSWHALAWVHLLDKELDAAQQAFEQALAVDRNFGDTYGGLAIVAALRGDRADADQLMRTGLRLDRLSLNVGMARSLLEQGGSLGDADVLASAFKMFDQQALSRNPALRSAFTRMVARRSQGQKR